MQNVQILYLHFVFIIYLESLVTDLDVITCFSKLLRRELVIEKSKYRYFHEKEGIADLDLKK